MKKIKLLLAAMAAMVGLGAQAQLTNGTVYWLQDTNTKQFISQGANWGTQATVQDVGGIGFEAVYVSDGVYKLKNIMWNKVNNADLGLRATDGYCDQAASELTLTASGDGYLVGIAGGNYLCNNQSANSYGVKPIGLSKNSTDATIWKFLTKAEYDAAILAKKDTQAASLAEAMGIDGITTLAGFETEIAGADYVYVDQTSKITNANLNEGNTNGWTAIKPNQRDQAFGSENGTMAEAWNGCVVASQSVTGLPNGLYKITFVGTFRPKGSSESERLTSEQTSSPAYVFANDDKEEFIHWIDVSAKANDRTGVKNNAESYTSTFYTYVTDGTINLGVKQDTWYNGSMWCPFGYFTLTQIYSLASYKKALNDAATATEAYNGIIPTAAYNAIQNVVTEANKTWSSIDDYQAAIDDINTAVSTYATADIIADYARYQSIKTAALAISASVNTATADSDVEAATTTAGIDAAIVTLRAAFTTYLAGANIEDNQIDITAVLIDNASPGTSGNLDYWTNSGSPSLEYQLYEYWNVSGATTQQTIATELPVGYYTLTAIAYTRDNMTATLNAGTNTINLVGCGTINDRNGGNNWIAQGNGNGVNELTFNLANATSNLEIGLTADSSTGDHWMCWRSFKLEYLGTNPISLMTDRYNDALDAATTARDNEAYANVIGSEKTTLLTAIAATPGTVAEYETAIKNLNDAVAAFIAAKTNYDALANEIAKANALGFDANSYAATDLTTADGALSNTQSLKVAEYTFVTNTYQYSVALDPDSWISTGSNKGANFSGEHWSGDITRQYKNQDDSNGQGWNSSTWDLNFNQNVDLPAGNYVFKVAGRHSSGNAITMSLVVKQGENVLGTVNDFPEGNKALGINTSGETDFTTGEGHTYANSGNGFGWEWRYVKFTLSSAGTVNVAVTAEATNNGQWICFGDYTLQTDDENNVTLISDLVAYNSALLAAENARDNATYTNVDGKEKADLLAAIDADRSLDKTSTSAVEAATTALTTATTAFTDADAVNNYGDLASAISAAQAIVDASINVGDGAFQIPASAQTTLSEAITTASSIKSNAETTATTAATAATTLNDAITAYNSTALTAPADDEVFNVMITTNDNYGFKDTPLTFKPDNGGGFFAKGVDVDANRAQQITFTQKTGNQYTLSMVNAEGTRVYIATNKTANNSGDNKQIRLTAEASKALAVEIVPTATAGVFNLRNTEANALLGCQDSDDNATGGFYTCSSHNNFVITAATKPIVEVHVAAGKLATRIFPFKPTLPSGVVAYSCSANTGTSLTLVEVAKPAANVPYILYSENECSSTNLTGWGSATADTYTEGYLTGVFARTEVPEGSYVLQTPTTGENEGKQAFYKVNQAGAFSSAYRVYVTVPAAGVKSFGFTLDDMQTAIEAARAEGENTVMLRYNVAGQQMQNEHKGLNIIKMADGSVRKVLVK